jgi:hypothetical protein
VLQAVNAGLWPAGIFFDPYFEYVTLLLHGDGTNGAQNNFFIDSSTNNFGITRNGNTTQGTLSPFGDNWSNYFNGTSDYLSAAANAVFNFGTGSFTVEAWVYFTTIQDTLVFDTRTSAATTGIGFQINSSGILCYIQATSTSLLTTALTVGAWNHVAWVFNGTSVTGYVNGVAGTPSTIVLTLTQNTPTVGRSGVSAASYMAGYISNLRVTKGGALYTTVFTPSTTPLTTTVSAGTVSLLTCQSNRFIDNSTNAFSITRNGTVSIQRFSPFSPPTTYSTSVIGGSGYFDGASYLLPASNAAFNFGTGDFTIEAWVYQPASGVQAVYDSRGSDASSAGFFFGTISSNFVIYTNATTAISTSMSLNTWMHFAIVRSGSTWTLYKNGVSAGTYSSSANLSDANRQIGASTTVTSSSANYFTGYISNLRVVKGTAVYTTTFTPSTTPLTAISGTSLLLNYTNAGIYDNAEMNNLETVGNAQVSTSVVKFGTGSMAFDGTGDWLTAIDTPNLQMGSGDFTIEGWIYLNAIGVAYGVIAKGTTSTGWGISVSSGNKLTFAYTATSLAGATSLAASTWYYFAVVRSGTATGNLKIYLNGSVDATSGGAVTDNFNQTNIFYVGASRTGTASLNGYLDDLRITKGYARTITTPTSAFPNQ